jgi:hypothetical protein
MTTVRTANGAKVRKSKIIPIVPEPDNPMRNTIVHNTSESSVQHRNDVTVIVTMDTLLQT